MMTNVSRPKKQKTVLDIVSYPYFLGIRASDTETPSTTSLPHPIQDTITLHMAIENFYTEFI